jgi:hypothetical protein
MCECCDAQAVGEILYEDGEILVGCADCLLDIAQDPRKPIHSIKEYETV